MWFIPREERITAGTRVAREFSTDAGWTRGLVRQANDRNSREPLNLSRPRQPFQKGLHAPRIGKPETGGGRAIADVDRPRIFGQPREQVFVGPVVADEEHELGVGARVL